ncbi:MAG: septum site determining protein, partial [Nocardioidaceae bacterium]|nr:septum site determining protein [Nocardioidaceae bacterium]
ARGARCVAVVGGRGGAGATTFATALALTAARVAPTILLDLDPLGPGLDRVVGLDGDADQPGVRWDALTGSHGRLGSRSLRQALPHCDGLAVLTWGAGTPDAVDRGTAREVLSAAHRGHDVVVVDLPRYPDEAVDEVVARCDDVVVVAEASVSAVAAAGRVVERLRALTGGLGAVVRAGPVPGDQVAGVLGIPLLAEVGHQRRLAEHLDLGLGPVHSRRSPLARASRDTLAALEARDPAVLRAAAS